MAVCASALCAREFTLEEAQTIGVNTYGSRARISPPADFDGDGLKDMISGVDIFFGWGNGTFVRKQIFLEPVNVLDAGDVDGDLNPDLLVIYPWYTRQVTGPRKPMYLEVQLNRRDPGGNVFFEAIQSWQIEHLLGEYPPPLEELELWRYARFCDLDLDGDLDLIGRGSEWVLYTNPNDGSSYPIGRSYYVVSLGDGSGGFSEFAKYPTIEEEPGVGVGHVHTFELADLSGDGYPDIAGAMGIRENRVTVALNRGDGSFEVGVVYQAVKPSPLVPDRRAIPFSVWPTDTDGDGDLDLVVGVGGAGAEGVVSVLLNDGHGTFEDGEAVVYGPARNRWLSFYNVASGDFNGDGRHDAVVATHPPSVLLLSAFQDPLELVVTTVFERDLNGETIDQIRADDLNDDDLMDVVINGTDCEAHLSPCTLVVFHGKLSADFLRGDANADGAVNLSDAVSVLEHLFVGEQVEVLKGCLDRGDADDNGVLSVTDAVYLLNHLFRGGPLIPPPFPAPGPDPTVDAQFCGQ